MSLPQFSDAVITREEAINEVISSIAMEELALSHIINAEGEKLQYALGTLSGSAPIEPATIDDLLAINSSIRETLVSAAESQTILKNKLQVTLESAVLTGPTGPTGATGAEGIQGIQGVAGTVGTIKGAYDSIDDLLAAHPTGEAGDFYYISPDLYVWDEDSSRWYDVGQIAGPQGIQGVQGIQGEQGEAGQDGAAATITVGTVSSVDYDQPPTVINSGSPQNAVLDFELPVPPLPPLRIYRTNLSQSTSAPLIISLADALGYELRYRNADEIQLFFRPVNGNTSVVCDYRIVSQYNATSVLTTYFNAIQGDSISFNPTSPAIDAEIYNNSQETHNTWIRVQNPTNPALWSTFVVNLFSSARAARVTVWVTVIEENVSY